MHWHLAELLLSNLGCSVEHPLQHTIVRASRPHGVCSSSVASYTNGLLVELCSLHGSISIFLTSAVCCMQLWPLGQTIDLTNIILRGWQWVNEFKHVLYIGLLCLVGKLAESCGL